MGPIPAAVATIGLTTLIFADSSVAQTVGAAFRIEPSPTRQTSSNSPRSPYDSWYVASGISGSYSLVVPDAAAQYCQSPSSETIRCLGNGVYNDYDGSYFSVGVLNRQSNNQVSSVGGSIKAAPGYPGSANGNVVATAYVARDTMLTPTGQSNLGPQQTFTFKQPALTGKLNYFGDTEYISTVTVASAASDRVFASVRKSFDATKLVSLVGSASKIINTYVPVTVTAKIKDAGKIFTNRFGDQSYYTRDFRATISPQIGSSIRNISSTHPGSSYSRGIRSTAAWDEVKYEEIDVNNISLFQWSFDVSFSCLPTGGFNVLGTTWIPNGTACNNMFSLDYKMSQGLRAQKNRVARAGKYNREGHLIAGGFFGNSTTIESLAISSGGVDLTDMFDFRTGSTGELLFSPVPLGSSGDPNVAPVPLPAGMALLLTALGFLGVLRLRKKASAINSRVLPA